MNPNQPSPLAFDAYQTFGKKAFFLFLAAWLETPFAFLFVGVLVSVARRMSLIPAEFAKLAAGLSLFCLIASIVGFVVCYFAGRMTFRSQGFCLTSDALKIRKGIFSKQESAIPYRQIQNVEIRRSFNQQLMGVSRLVIVTAGSDDEKTADDESKGIIESLDRDLATALQEELLRRADVQRIVSVQR